MFFIIWLYQNMFPQFLAKKGIWNFWKKPLLQTPKILSLDFLEVTMESTKKRLELDLPLYS